MISARLASGGRELAEPVLGDQSGKLSALGTKLTLVGRALGLLGLAVGTGIGAEAGGSLHGIALFRQRGPLGFPWHDALLGKD